MLRALHCLRSFGQRCFLRFGLHCATHQIRVILISCVVITSLFYPALAIYSSQPLSLSFSDAFAARNLTSNFHAYDDLVNLWSGHDHIKLHEDAVSRVKCGAGRALRVEQLLIRNSIMDDAGAVNQRLLLFVLSLEERLSSSLSAGDYPCLKRADGRCFVISPLLFWDHDKDTLLADVNVLNTLSSARNVTVDDITITPQMVLAGRTSREHRSTFDFAAFLVLTYFFPESDCLGMSEHAAWRQSVHNVVSHDADIISQPQGPTLIALEYEPGHSRGKNGSGLATFVNMAYLCFFVYVVWSVRRMDAVHSRLGVTFTALVEIAVSTITSLSVCALVGFKITMVPWELLPIVIVFVGAENMFNLVDAVGKTSVTLPVKQRIAEGLSRAGTSNTLKVLSYITILGLIAMFSLGAVRQFCIFAIVVLIAHWFLAHTFFMAVLSIDIQRLELEELLRHDPTVVPNPSQKPDVAENFPKTRWGRLIRSVQNLLKGRAATNISLLMLLAITAALYYMTYFSSLTAQDPRQRVPTVTIPQGKVPISSETIYYSTAGHVWRKMNPSQQRLLHLRIEDPILITPLPDSDFAQRYQDNKSQRTFRLFLWLLKLMMLPIAGTTSMLYFLLLYLLKDAELLEAQRNREGPESVDFNSDRDTFEGRISFSTLPRAFTSDVELVSSSKDGETVIAVGLNNELMVWRASQSSVISVDVEERLPTFNPSSSGAIISSIAVEENGEYFAVGTNTGTILVWDFDKQTTRLLRALHPDQILTRVVNLRFISSSRVALEKLPISEMSLPAQSHPTIVASFEKGSVVKWVMEDELVCSNLIPNRKVPVSRALLLATAPDDALCAAFIFNDGYVELLDAQKNEPFIGSDCCLQVGETGDQVAEIHICRLKLRGTTRTVMALTIESGRVSLWDLYSKEQICDVGCIDKAKQPRIIQGLREACRTCGNLPLENFFFAFVVEQNVKFYQLVLHDQVRYCSCLSNMRQRSTFENVNRSSRSEATALQSFFDTHSLRSRLSSANETSSFPISGHGIYPRRTSENTRRSSEISMIPFPGEDYESIHILGTNVLKPHMQRSSSSVWHNHSIVHLLDVPCGKGGWDLVGQKAVGVRRKERLKQQKVKAAQQASLKGLSKSTLERWEMWIFDPAKLRLQTSLLSAIVSQETIDSNSSSPSSHAPRMPFTHVSPLVVASSSYALAGFGNTIGIFTFSNT
ncbi:hypothetical protein AX15_004932 [Amanita polypyramis BW_CC]|nr:hypothetical protein AX15_004932 [Amanita polypyramis BW_CC]